MQAIDGENSAARDMATRQKIASFPPEIHDPALLSQVKGEVRGKWESVVKKILLSTCEKFYALWSGFSC